MKDVKAFLRWIIRWFPAVALTAAVTYFSTVYGIIAVLWFSFGVLKLMCAAMAAGVIACVIVACIAWLYEAARAWIYE